MITTQGQLSKGMNLLYSINEILSWTHEQTDKYRKCSKCHKFGSFAVVPKDKYMQYSFLCGDHYEKEQNKKS